MDGRIDGWMDGRGLTRATKVQRIEKHSEGVMTALIQRTTEEKYETFFFSFLSSPHLVHFHSATVILNRMEP